MTTANTKSRRWRLPLVAFNPQDLDVDRNMTVAGTVDVTGAMTVGGTLAVTGAVTQTGKETFVVPSSYSNGTGISAGATQTQAGATLLTKEYNNVTTVATAQDGVRLPTAVAGLRITVRNSGASVLKVWPFLGDAIDALAVDLGISLALGGELAFAAIDATTWQTKVALTSHAPSTQKGSLTILAADSAGETETKITNASQAAARTYTVPDAGADANFVMSQGTATIVGAKTFSTAIVPTGGVAVSAGTAGPRLVHSGGAAPATLTTGTDTTPSVTETHIVEVFVPCNMTVVGVSLLNGSANAGNYRISMADSAGVPIAAAITASTAGAGTSAYQRIPFAVSWAAVGPATYYILLQNNNTGNRFRTHAGGDFGASVKTGETFGTFTTVTPATTFTASKGPIASLYT